MVLMKLQNSHKTQIREKLEEDLFLVQKSRKNQ